MSADTDGKNVFWSEAMVASKTKEPVVEMRFNGQKLQVTTAQARDIAIGILDAAATAEVDAAVFAFGTENVGQGDERAGAALVDQVRQFRIKQAGEQ